ncbi:MAG: hypothetical protein FJX75_03025 [Armatimonadetes bacterium]|nr:hypothetical protein [Armatimonadota bacterium]
MPISGPAPAIGTPPGAGIPPPMAGAIPPPPPPPPPWAFGPTPGPPGGAPPTLMLEMSGQRMRFSTNRPTEVVSGRFTSKCTLLGAWMRMVVSWA